MKDKIVQYKKYIIAGVVVVIALGIGIGVYVCSRQKEDLPKVYETPVNESKLTPEELEELKKDEEKVHTDEDAVPLEEDALEAKPENADPEAEKEAMEIQKTAEDDYKQVYETQQEKLNSGELVVGEKTDIENGVIAKEDVLEYSDKDDVLKKVNYSTEKAIADIKKEIGPGGKEYEMIEGMYDEKDWNQLISDPYSSRDLSQYFNEYKQYGDLETFKLSVAAWLQNGGDDGVAHGEVFG